MEHLRDYIRAVLAGIDNCHWIDHPRDKGIFKLRWYRFRLINRDHRKILEFHKFERVDYLLCVARTKTCSGFGKPIRIRLEAHDQVVNALSAIAADASINIP